MPISDGMRCLGQKHARLVTCLLTAVITLILPGSRPLGAQSQLAGSSGSAQIAKAVGTIKSIQADSITVAVETGGEITAKLSSSTKLLSVPPGEKDLKNATALQAQDLQPGDRVLVRGQAATNGDGHTIAALAVIVMKQADVAAKQQHDRDDWQKRGAGGLVTQVEAATGTITVASSGAAPNRSIVVHVAATTILRRYAQGSVKFDDAKPAPIDQIKPGDQLRARGTRNADGSEVNAEEIVTGAFRNIAGTIKSIDASGNAITVQDALAKSAVVVKVSPDSQIKKLPADMAQRIAIRLKGAAAGGNGDQPGANSQSNSSPGTGRAQSSASAESRGSRGTGAGPGANGPLDLQRVLSRLPNSSLADLRNGDAVMIVSTESGNADTVTAITLLAGVEAILTAAPNHSASSLLSPWSLGAPTGEGEAAP